MIQKSSQVQVLKKICKHKNIILDFSRGDYICSNCGLVISQYYVAPTYKMNPVNNDKNNSSARHYISLGERLHIIDGLGSFIDYEHSNFFSDSQGIPLSAKSQALFKRLKYYDLRARIAKKETDYRALKTLNHVIQKLKLNSQIRDRAAYFYHKIIKNKTNGKITNHILLISLCLLLAVREYKENAPVTIQEIAKTFRVLGHRVSERGIIQLGLKIRPNFNKIFKNKIRRSEEYLPRIISDIMKYPKVKLRLIQYKIDNIEYESNLRQQTRKILEIIDFKKRGGRNPYIFAVASVYAADQLISSNKKIHSILTQKILSEATHCAEYSIRDHWRGLLYDFIKKLKNKNIH
ncbi:MAG: TFIIB-type zinc ribbon-containing protein [Candidatus Helarchaeota archaeon]